MSQVINLKLAGNSGVNYDLEPCDLPPDFFTSGNDFVLRNGKIYTVSSGSLIATAPISFGGSQLMFVNNAPNLFYVIAGLTKVYCYTGSAWSDITSAIGYAGLSAGDQFKWTCCKLGNIPIFNNPIVSPEYWSPQSPTQVMQPLLHSAGNTWASKNWHCQSLRAHKNFLFALNMTENGTALPNNYRWSTAADNNGLPFTWDETDLAGIAGQASILGNTGGIVDGLTLRDDFVIYSTYGITLLRYIGGAYLWEARTLSSTQGLINRNCIADIYGRHIFLSNNDLLITDGNSVKSIAYGVVLKKLQGIIDPTNYHLCYCSVDHTNKEVLFCMPTIGSSFTNIAFVYNWVEDKISIRDLDFPISSMAHGAYSFTTSSWSSLTRTWSQAIQSWDYSYNSPFSLALVGVDSTTSNLYNMNSIEAIADIDTYLERISAQLTSQMEVTTILKAIPHIKSFGTVSFQFGSQMTINEGIIWQPEIIFNPTTQRKIEIRTTGVLHSWIIKSIGSEQFIYSGMDIEYVINGGR